MRNIMGMQQAALIPIVSLTYEPSFQMQIPYWYQRYTLPSGALPT